MMKKKLWWILPAVVMAGLVMMGCPTDTGGGGDTVTITWDVNGGKWADNSTAVKKSTINKGSTVTPPASPTKDGGFTFKEWNSIQSGVGGTGLWGAAKTYSRDTTFYAQYQQGFIEKPAEELELATPTTESNYKKWVISDDDFTAIKDAVSGSQLRLHITVPTDRHDWGLGAIGIADGATLDLTVPSNQTGTEVTINIWVAWLLDKIGDETPLAIMLWTDNNGSELTKIELIEPETPFNPPEPPKPPTKPAQRPMEYFDFVQEITTTGGSEGSEVTGKGNIEDPDLGVIKAAKAGSILRFYMKNVTDPYASRAGWNDVGTVGSTTSTGKVNMKGVNEYDTTEHLFIFDLPISELDGVYPLASATFIFVNPYNGCIVALCELWSPQEGVVIPEKIVVLEENFEYGTTTLLGYQAVEAGLFTRVIWEGDEYKLTGTFTSDVDVDEIRIYLVDNSSAADWWKELSVANDATTAGIKDIVADEETDIELTVVATDTAIGTSASDMKLVFSTGTSPGEEITLKFWEWTFTKTKDGEEPDVPPVVIPDPTLDLRNLGAFNITNDSKAVEESDQPGWAVNGHGDATTDLLWTEIQSAKYLVIECFGPGGNAGGFGGIRMVLNNDGTNWQGQETNIMGDWLSYTRADSYYIVLNLAGLTGWTYFKSGGMTYTEDETEKTTTASGNNGYICIASWPFSSVGFVAGYLTDMELVKPSDAVDLDNATYGYVTKDATIFEDGE
jgi:hypothetical protein